LPALGRQPPVSLPALPSFLSQSGSAARLAANGIFATIFCLGSISRLVLSLPTPQYVALTTNNYPDKRKVCVRRQSSLSRPWRPICYRITGVFQVKKTCSRKSAVPLCDPYWKQQVHFTWRVSLCLGYCWRAAAMQILRSNTLELSAA
jgi:hypothetical protein